MREGGGGGGGGRGERESTSSSSGEDCDRDTQQWPDQREHGEEKEEENAHATSSFDVFTLGGIFTRSFVPFLSRCEEERHRRRWIDEAVM